MKGLTSEMQTALEAYRAFTKGKPQPTRRVELKSIPRDQWPIWTKALSKFATPEDKGIGDVAARMIGDEKSAAFKLWFKATFEKDCGCAGRQREWNRKYPL